MFGMEAKVIVEFADIAFFAEKHRDMTWNGVHDMLFRSYDSPLQEGTFLYERNDLQDFNFEPNVLELLITFMDHNELEEFFWLDR